MSPVTALRLQRLLLTGVLLTLSGCAVIAVTSTVVGAGVSVASTAVDAVVVVGKGAVNAGGAVVGAVTK